MIRLFTLLTAFGLLASCAQYQEPKANCFSFLAAVAPVDSVALAAPVAPDCLFTPINGLESDVEA
jgi:hypothetical protein